MFLYYRWMDFLKLCGLMADLFVGQCGSSGGEDEDHSEEGTDSEVCGYYNINSVKHHFQAYNSLYIQVSTFVLEMRNAMPTTPRTLSSTCTQKKAKVCLTAGRMYLDTCNRWAMTCSFSVVVHCIQHSDRIHNKYILCH